MIGKRIVAIALVGIGMMGIGGCQHTQADISNIYPQYSVVIGVDADKDIVTVECNSGTRYHINGIEDWQEGDICSLLLDTNGTDEVTDDRIIKAEYDGYEW